MLCSDGTYVPVGRAFIGGDHPDVHLAAQAALDCYTATSLAWADIRVGTDKFGIWYAGVTRPGISEELVYAARASGISGDWRPINAVGASLPPSAPTPAASRCTRRVRPTTTAP